MNPLIAASLRAPAANGFSGRAVVPGGRKVVIMTAHRPRAARFTLPVGVRSMSSSVRWSVGVGVVLFAVTAVGLVGGGRPTAAGENKASLPAANVGPVPAEGFAVLSVNVAKLHDADAGKPLRAAVEKGDKAMLRRIEADFGIALADVDRVTFLWPAPNYNLLEGAAATFVTTRKPFDKAKLFKTWRATTEPSGGATGAFGAVGFGGLPPGGLEMKGCVPQVFPGSDQPKVKGEEKVKPLDRDAPFYYAGRHAEVVLIPLDERTVVFVPAGVYTSGNPGFLAALLRRRADGPLADPLALAAKHDVVMGVSGKHVREQFKLWREVPAVTDAVPALPCNVPPPPVKPQAEPKPKEGGVPPDPFTPYDPLAEIDRAVLTFDFGPTCTLGVTAHFPTDDAAKKAEPAVKKVLTDVADELNPLRKAAADDPAEKDWLPVYDFALAGLKGAKLTREGKTLSLTATADILADLKAAFATLPGRVQEAADRMRTHNNLRQIAAALQTYHDTNGNLPKDVTDENGKVLLSWRVELLPYLDPTGDLNARIDRTKAWDDPANKKLWDDMPDCFRVPHRPTAEGGQTYFQAFRTVNWIGKDDPWLVDSHKTLLTDITDGTAHTAAVFETAEATNWMKPGGPLFDPKKLAAVGDPKTGKVTVVMLDQTVRVLDGKKYTGGKLAAIITGNGGEEIDENDFK